MVTTIWLDKTRSDGAEHYKAQKHKGCQSQTRKQVHHTVRSWPASPPPATLATYISTLLTADYDPWFR